jgi:hypothetical protein
MRKDRIKGEVQHSNAVGVTNLLYPVRRWPPAQLGNSEPEMFFTVQFNN